MPEPIQLSFVLNGNQVTVATHPDTSLLELLRDEFGLTSPKNGCSPLGQCGGCTVLVDGKATVSCVTGATRVAGKSVLTLEGLAEQERKIWGQAFLARAGLQCGFCIPGIVMRGKYLLSSNPSPTREEIAKALNNHICRCTGYVKIIDAIDTAAKTLAGEPAPELDYSGRVGTSLPRVDGAEMALGQRPYIDDMKFPGMVYGALLFAPAARCRIKRIDTSRARRMPGVHAVLTAEDVPGERHQGLITRDWPVFIAEGEETRYVGDVLAAVAAESEKAARAAVEAIQVEYEELPPVTDPRAALRDDAPKIHPEGNLLSKSVLKRGDVDAALAGSAHVVRQTLRTQMVEHAFLEPESCIALPHEGGVEVYSQGQGIFDDRRQIAAILGLPEERVCVTLVANGGAFGGKEDMSIQGQTALLAWKAQRPVKLTLRRAESIRIHPKRHPIEMEYTVGCDADGHLTAVRAGMMGDTGAYASVGAKVLERAAGHACGPYRVPNVDVEALAVYTNNPPCGAMRGFGANQAAFGIETMVDLLAEKVGIDGWEMRWRNALDVGDTFATGQVLHKSVGIKKTLLAVKDAYRSARYAGIACGIKNVGIGNALEESGQAYLVIEPDATVTIYTGFTEMGQGLFTVLVQVLSEVTGIDPRRVRVRVDTSRPVPCGMTTASRATLLGGNAVKVAAEKLRQDLESASLEDLVGKEYFGEVVDRETTRIEDTSRPQRTHITYGFATQVVILDDDGKLKKVVAAHDVGRAMNPQLLEGQIEGAVHMGLGYALTEELRLENGAPRKYDLRSLGILRAKGMPEVEVNIIEETEPEGPFGAKGVGEIGLVPTAPAVASALYRFDGIRRFSLPMKDSAAARAIVR